MAALVEQFNNQGIDFRQEPEQTTQPTWFPWVVTELTWSQTEERSLKDSQVFTLYALHRDLGLAEKHQGQGKQSLFPIVDGQKVRVGEVLLQYGQSEDQGRQQADRIG